MTDLPIEEIRPGVVAVLQRTNRLIIKAPTGSGKSTRVPRMLLEEVFPRGGEILILQPRRLAARMLAARVAAEGGTRLGEEVGYQIRLERVASKKTRICFLTEGILLRRMLEDPFLDGVAAVILDEFHERHLHGDISLARVLDLQEQGRADLKVLIMSATLDGPGLQNYLGPTAEIIESAGRMHPVEIRYLAREPGDESPWDLAARLLRAEFPKTSGHALVFMPGAYEIQRTVRALREEFSADVPIFPLHGEMPARDQDEAVAVGERRKIIVSTNVAETSLTIDGVTLVVDSGLARVGAFDPQRGINTLLVEKISRAAAEQRAGRAGRTAPGLCLRLWTLRDQERRPEREIPEVHRLDLAETVLTLKACGVGDLEGFRWFDRPEDRALERAVLLLKDLGALSQDAGELTATGRRMVSFPAHPRMARLLLEADKRGCAREAALLAALTQSRSLLAKADRRTEEAREDLFGGGESDFTFLFRAFEFARRAEFRTSVCREMGIHAETARQVARLFEQFLSLAQRSGLRMNERAAAEEDLGRCILAAFADQVGRRRSSGNYQCDLVHGRRGLLDRASQAGGSWLVVAAEIHEIGKTAGETEVRLGLVTAIEEAWLQELYPDDFHETQEVLFDSSQNRVVERRATIFRDLILRSSDRDATPGAPAAAVLAGVIRERGIKLEGWGEAEEQWIARVNFASRNFPELEIPAITAEDRGLLLEQFCEGAVCLRDVRDKPARGILRSWLRPDQAAAVDRLVPDRISLPGGKSAKVRYEENGEARVAVRIQELFGTTGGLSIGGGRIPLLIEVLAPNQRPVQVTRDLTTFWQETYPKLRQQLQRRYPRHRWDPCPGAAQK